MASKALPPARNTRSSVSVACGMMEAAAKSAPRAKVFMVGPGRSGAPPLRPGAAVCANEPGTPRTPPSTTASTVILAVLRFMNPPMPSDSVCQRRPGGNAYCCTWPGRITVSLGRKLRVEVFTHVDSPREGIGGEGAAEDETDRVARLAELAPQSDRSEEHTAELQSRQY